jgi:asparagine synthase (glutamine-hydrolysing)
MPWELPHVLDADLAKQGWRDLHTLPALTCATEGIRSSRLKISSLEATWYMRNQLLRDTDWASMTHSLEVRVPLVDWTLWKTVVPLAVAGRPFDKRAMASTPRLSLPPEVLGRAKTGFTVPTMEWVANEHAGRQRERGLRGWARRVYEAVA